jgi:hypothetical protein
MIRSSPFPPEAPSGIPTLRLGAVEHPNDRYKTFAEKRLITIPRQPLLGDDDAVFTMGSCFAEEIRTALVSENIRCVPNYNRIAFDRNVAVVDTLPEREHMNYYNTFTIKLQFEQILDIWQQDPDDYWEIGRLSRKVAAWDGVPNFQDPYRRLVVARTPELLQHLIQEIVKEMRRAFNEARAFIFTFGMTEVFRNRRSGRVVCQRPAYAGGGGLSETERHDSSFAENLENVRSIVKMIRNRKPAAPIILSVSPVPLARTFGNRDVVTASMEGKSILRAVLGQVTREFEGVAYLPSYEYVTLLGAVGGFRDDLRHVRQEAVGEIVTAFLAAFRTFHRGTQPAPAR